MKNRSIFLFSVLILSMLAGCSPKKSTDLRMREDFGWNWMFHLGDVSGVVVAETDTNAWQWVDLPHDWSIAGSFSKDNPATASGGALPGGIAWYRKQFTLPVNDTNRMIFIDFDGVYRNSEVWINGQYLGKRPYGYSSFRYNLTPHLKFGEQSNILVVRVDNSAQMNSRWYSGSGIYRNVWLVTTNKLCVDHWGTYVNTPQVSPQLALIKLKTILKNYLREGQSVNITTTIFDAKGNKITGVTTSGSLPSESISEFNQEFKISNPSLWSVDQPSLYKAVSQVTVSGKQVDEYETTFGIRTIRFDKQKGFFLNDQPLKIRGVCNHHDLGCLGAAINVRALERQIELLKEMGCNAIRTSHNPPAPELLDLCDRMGFLVMDEAFDMWSIQKTPFDYHLDWKAWHARDLSDMIRRDRNHPSVIIWSIGNEIPDQEKPVGDTIARELVNIVHGLDLTRPITSACNMVSPKNSILRSGALDLVGTNYAIQDYPRLPQIFPGGAFIATETTSALATRGVYNRPADSIYRWPDKWSPDPKKMNTDLTCPAYDNCSTPWGSTHEESWRIIKKYPFLSGMFIWTGFDYLGEPTPYDFPARSSYFGILDLAGFPKDAYYMYQSEWTSKPVLHIVPHWNWQGKEGKPVDVWVYSNCREVELFLNGKSLGKKSKSSPDELHLAWKVPFEAGTLKAVGMNDGKTILTTEVRTAGAAAKIVLQPDRSNIRADGRDISFVKITIVDKDGIPVPNADNLVRFNVSDKGTIAGVDNGNPVSMESFKANTRKAFNGLCLAVIRSTEKPGNIKLEATADGLEGASIIIQSK